MPFILLWRCCRQCFVTPTGVWCCGQCFVTPTGVWCCRQCFVTPTGVWCCRQCFVTPTGVWCCRQCFVHDDTNFTLDAVTHPEGDSTYLLSLETSREGDEALARVPSSFQVTMVHLLWAQWLSIIPCSGPVAGTTHPAVSGLCALIHMYSHLVYSHLVYSQSGVLSFGVLSFGVFSFGVLSIWCTLNLVYSHLVYSHLVYSHLVYSQSGVLSFGVLSIAGLLNALLCCTTDRCNRTSCALLTRLVLSLRNALLIKIANVMKLFCSDQKGRHRNLFAQAVAIELFQMI